MGVKNFGDLGSRGAASSSRTGLGLGTQGAGGWGVVPRTLPHCFTGGKGDVIGVCAKQTMETDGPLR